MVILPKLLWDKPLARWIVLVGSLGIDPAEISSKNIKALIRATNAKQSAKVSEIARTAMSATAKAA
jgi:hypothetical protein